MTSKIEKYITNDLIKLLLPLLISLLTFCIYSYYTKSKLYHQSHNDFKRYNDSTFKYLKKSAELEGLIIEVMQKSLGRRKKEDSIFLFLQLPTNDLKNIPFFTSDLKLDLAVDKGELNKYSNQKIGYPELFNNCNDLLESELDYIKDLEEYFEFKSNPLTEKLYDLNMYKKTENASLLVTSKISEISHRVNKADLESLLQKDKEEIAETNNEYLLTIQEITYLLILSIIGITISSFLIIGLIYISLKLNLFGKNPGKSKKLQV